MWRMLLRTIQKLGIAGMSSDETDATAMQVVYRIKVLVWRRQLEMYLDLVDDHRYRLPTEEYAERGIQPKTRIRPDLTLYRQAQVAGAEASNKNPYSERAPVRGLPRDLYDPQWLASKGPAYVEFTLCVSKEQFQWVEAVVERADEKVISLRRNVFYADPDSDHWLKIEMRSSVHSRVPVVTVTYDDHIRDKAT